jgi:hypothetical protein
MNGAAMIAGSTENELCIRSLRTDAIQPRQVAARVRYFLVCACLSASALILSAAVDAQTFSVISTADSGAGSLRDAIGQANAGTSPPYAINFDINTATDPGCAGTPKVCTIAPLTDLPSLQKNITINGFTQAGASANTAVFGSPTNAVYVLVLDGSGSAPGAVGFAISSVAGATIRGFSVVGWQTGIKHTGVELSGIGLVSGNYIGLLPDGVTLKANSVNGIWNTGSGLVIGTNLSPPLPADRNVIAGSTHGIYASSDFLVRVSGNYVGTDASGLAARANQDGIVYAQTTSAESETIDYNVVSGNANHGILIASFNVGILSSRIGTNAPGTAALPNGFGVTFTNGGGFVGRQLSTDLESIVSGNIHDGITFNAVAFSPASGFGVQNTLVGTDVNMSALGNGGAGVVANATKVRIGNPSGGQNVIAYNLGDGIDIVDVNASVYVSANSIHDNAGLGVSFRPGLGPTPNDSLDDDSGPDGLQNYPLMTSAAVSGGSVTIAGALNSTPNTTFDIDLFGNDSCDKSGHGQGKYYIGQTTVATDVSGHASFNVTRAAPAAATEFSALASDHASATGSSEFSNCATSTLHAPVFLGAASRKVHGAAGTFDLPLSLVATNPTTEPRIGPTQTLVFTFDKAVTGATATTAEGTAMAERTLTFSGNDVVVPLTVFADRQYVTITLSNVIGADGSTEGSAAVRLGFLLGDVNGSRVVSVADVGLVNAQLAQVVTAANYLKDVNASGTLSVADKGLTNANLTRALPAP